MGFGQGVGLPAVSTGFSLLRAMGEETVAMMMMMYITLTLTLIAHDDDDGDDDGDDEAREEMKRAS